MSSDKKGFDKEYIFNLIMPSEPIDGSTNSHPNTNLQGNLPSDMLSALREQIKRPPPPTVKLRSNKELVLINLREQSVADRLDEVFSKFNCCRCDKCRCDVAALALNNLSPQYVVASPDDIPTLLKECSSNDISAALVKAVLFVKGHPKH